MNMPIRREPNALIHSASPYLLQHAYNPVKWHPWSAEALQRARDENKLLLISIGYSACHWCHVMEHESFEDEEIAAIMNRSFVCIKVDREERPDIDQIYMDAVQLMTGRGGWPLNAIALPDQRPVYGGTYFPKEQWRNVLLQLESLYTDDPQRCVGYAEELNSGMRKMATKLLNPPDVLPQVDHPEMLSRWMKQCDHVEGGPDRSPKFPLPDSYRYLLAAASTHSISEVEDHVHLTLKKMAFGGIFDQIGGGFARYSTDSKWKVPHFEKMLYDNALLLSLYADAIKQKPCRLYNDVIAQTLDFVAREMKHKSGGFFSAMDADSEGVEGKYYCWSPSDLDFLGEEADLARDYFNINSHGYWEHDFYIPLRREEDEVVAERYSISIEELNTRILAIRTKMLDQRSSRVKPGLDDKMLCSWNAMMVSACLDAYTATLREQYLKMAKEGAEFIKACFFHNGDRLWHCAKDFDGDILASVEGFLEDYAFTCESFLNMYSVTSDFEWLDISRQLAETVIRDFSDHDTGMFWFTSENGEQLIMRKHELSDNVIPSSNSVMAHVLYRLSVIFGNEQWRSRSLKMIQMMQSETVNFTPWYSRWARLQLETTHGAEVAVCTADMHDCLKSLHNMYLPLCLIVGTDHSTSIPFFNHRFDAAADRFYICRGQTCLPPLSKLDEVKRLLRTNPTTL